MAYNTQQLANTGVYVPTTFLTDVARLSQTDVRSPEFKQLLVKLYQDLNTMALALNVKESAFYVLEEFNTGQLYFNPTSNDPALLRNVYRLVLNIGALGAGATATNHNLPLAASNPPWTFTHIYGAANDTINNISYPLPFASAGGAANIEVQVTATQVVITNNSGVAFDVCSVVLEYVKT